MKLNLKEVKIKNIDGTEMPNVELNKLVANLMYQNAKNLDLVDLALKLYNEGEIEVRDSELQEIQKIVMNSTLPAFVKKAFLDYINKDVVTK